ncbi:C40 family peptidase [Hellea balneolensis]|uniref:C40 family peptidase n=1 Tax=Hellea balneolensis TaxID=287478 RepID=UPI000413699D|nr:NlpC/P60 family protein [Hellea balneolensis]
MQRSDPRLYIPRQKGPHLSTRTVTVPIAPLHSKASKHSGQDTQLLYGHHFDVYEVKKGWVWGQAKSPLKGSKEKGYVGFVPSRFLEEAKVRATHIVTALKAPMFTAPDIKSHIVQSLPLGAHVKAQEEQADFLQIGAGGYIHQNHVRAITKPYSISDYVEVAEAHLGLPYVWGGISTDGLDCSGLVLSALRATGRDALRDTDMMEATLGHHLHISQRGLKRGDLIFWKGHVGIMQTSGRLLHANAYHMCVSTEPLREAARRIMERGGGPMTAIKRL